MIRLALALTVAALVAGLVRTGGAQAEETVDRIVGPYRVTFGYSEPQAYMEELATAGYATLSPATKIKLATLPKGELMLRHPHFTQPIFVRFPRPAMLTGREGVERFPPAAELPFADAVARQLRQLDRRISVDDVRARVEGRRDDDVRRALAATRRARPEEPMAYFVTALGRRVQAEVVQQRRPVTPIASSADPYGTG